MLNFLFGWIFKKEKKELDRLISQYTSNIIVGNKEKFNEGWSQAYAQMLSAMRTCPTEFRVFLDQLEHMEIKDLLEACEKVVGTLEIYNEHKPLKGEKQC
jgi:hypothetical protein